MKMFKSDNNSGVHPQVMEAIIKANKGHDNPYGGDRTTREAEEKLRELFGLDIDVYFVTSGTAANIIGLASLLKPFEAIVTPDTAHIHTDECGSLERILGNKILYTPNRDGKIVKEDIRPFLINKGNEHKIQPKVISISQTSEMGTLYSLEEIKDLADFAHANDMYLHMDGARIANAVVALDSSFKEMVSDTGVDLLSFGGTKNGMMIGEAIISFNKELSESLKFHRKQGMQLLSKMRFISAQFIGYLENDLWKENAKHANDMGQYLIEELSKYNAVQIRDNMKTNMIFANFDQKIIDNLMEKIGFSLMDEDTRLVRLVTSYDTSKEDIDNFIKEIRDIYLKADLGQRFNDMYGI